MVVLPRKSWKKIANFDKNSIKHFDSESERYIEIDVENEARTLIGDAITNHMILSREISAEIEQFNEAVK